jgi:hypothetical protein
MSNIIRHVFNNSSFEEAEPADDIPLMLRNMADEIEDQIEKGGDPSLSAAFVLASEAEIHIYGWGETKSLDSVYMLLSKAKKIILDF